MGTIHIYRPDGTSEKREASAPPSLKELQSIVDGYIELVYVLHEGNRQMMIVNEEGHLLHLAFNEAATRIYHNASAKRAGMHEGTLLHDVSYIVGTAVLLIGSDVWLD